MKICCCSRSFARALHSGGLTQLEWIDRCAEAALDGVDFAAAHFPRTDDDYLAQLKKLCVDRGLTVAALSADFPFGEGAIDPQVEQMTALVAMAAALGAPLMRIFCGAAVGSPGIAWRELIRGLKHVAGDAKQRNVTLALEPRAGSMISSAPEVKRAIKECDSAWLRLGPSIAAFSADPAAEWGPLLADAVIAVAGGDITEEDAAAARRAGYLGFVTFDVAGSDEAAVLGAIRSARAFSRF